MNRYTSACLLLLITLFSSVAVSAQNISWSVEYFNNQSLSGVPTVVDSVASPSNDWGSGSPDASLDVDNFSARWRSSVVLTGTYQFTARADDGIRVWVGSTLLIDEWHGASGQEYTANFTGTASSYVITVEYYEGGGNASLSFNFTNISGGTGSTGGGSSTVSTSGPWAAQYYNNTTLSGTPVTQNEASPTHNWGVNAPVNGINADNFSARWATNVTINGTYRVEVSADDGVRVWVNGVNIIDEWHGATAQKFISREFTLNGSFLVVVEYYEATGNAHIEFNIVKVTGVTDGQGGGGGGTTTGTPIATVATGLLNVRSSPMIDSNNIITRIKWGEKYPVIGRSGDLQWYQLNFGSFNGWVYAELVEVNAPESVPVMEKTVGVIPQPTGLEIHVRANLNVRQHPTTSSQLLNRIPYTQTAKLIARNANATWWLVEYRGTVGWVSGFYVILPYGVDARQIPVAR